MTGETLAGAPDQPELLDSREAGGKVIRGGAVRVVTYVLGLVVGLVSAPLLLRHLSLAEYGVFATVNSIVFVIGGLTEGGLGNVAMREFTRADDRGRLELLSDLLGLRLAMSTAGVLLALAFTVVVGYPGIYTAGVAICAAGLVAGAAQNAWSTALQAELKLGWLSAVDVARQVATTVAIVLLVVAGAALEPFFAVYTFGLLVMLASTLVPAGRWRRLRPAYDRARWGELLRQTALFAVATAVGVVYFQIAIISTSLLADDAEAGLYGAAFRVLELANGVPWLLVTAAFPVVARAAATDPARLRHALQKLFDVALLAGGLFTVAIVVGAPVAMAFLGGDKLDPAIGVLQVLGLALPFRFLVATWTYALLSVHADRGLLAANGLALAVSIVLSVVLIPPFGALGAAYVTTVLEVVLTAALAVALVRARPDLRPQVAGVPRFAACLGIALAAGLLVPLPAVPATALAAALYAVAMAATGGVPGELREAVAERLGPRPRGG